MWCVMMMIMMIMIGLCSHAWIHAWSLVMTMTAESASAEKTHLVRRAPSTGTSICLHVCTCYECMWSECAIPCPDVNLSIPSPKALKCHGYTMLCHDANILASFQYYFDSGIILSHLTDRVRSMDRLSGGRRTITAIWQKDSATSQQCILHRWSCHVGFR